MPTFAEMWNADVTQPVGFGIFDPQGTNYNATGYGLTPQFSSAQDFSGSNTILPSLTGTGSGADYSLGPNLFDVSSVVGNYNTTPQNAPAQKTQADCGFFDFKCKYDNFKMPTMQDVIGGTISGMTGGAIGSGGQTGWLESYFIRAMVIILGFIFVAAGLMMFQGKNIVTVATTAAKVVK